MNLATRTLRGDVQLTYRPEVCHHEICPGEAIDLLVAREVIESDGYGLMRLHRAGFKPESVIDLGANIGCFGAFAWALWKPKILSVEPDAGFSDLIKVNAPGELITGFVGSNRISVETLTKFPHLRCLLQVPVYTFESLLDRVGGSLDLLKCDIERSEIEVFNEMASYGLTPAIKVMVGEWHGVDALDAIQKACDQSHVLHVHQLASEERGVFMAIQTPTEKRYTIPKVPPKSGFFERSRQLPPQIELWRRRP